MAGKGVQLGRVVAEEEGECDGRERVRVGVVGGARENHGGGGGGGGGRETAVGLCT